MEENKKIEVLQVLRFVMFMFIFLHHMSGYFNIQQCDLLANTAVDFFFVLSGFVIYLSYKNKLENTKVNVKNCFDFAFNKIKKFYIFYIVTLLLTVPITFVRFHELYEFTFGFTLKFILSLISNIFLIQSWIPDTFYLANFNGPSWFLSATVFFYLISIPIIKLMNRISQKSKNLIPLLLGLVFFLKILFMQIDNSYLTYYSPIGRIFEYVIGMLLCRIMISVKENKTSEIIKKIVFTILEIVSIISVICVNTMSIYIIGRLSYILLSVILIVFIFSFEYGIISKIISRKTFVYLGNKNDKFYLFHVIPIWYLCGVVKAVYPNANKYLIIFITLLITITFSIALEKLINSIKERGIKKGTKRFFNDYKEILKKFYFKYIGRIKQKKFKYKNFTIISNNCFGGIIYRNNAMEYRTPTAGLFFMASDYIKFIYDMDNYLSKEVEEISIEESKYKDYLKDINYNAPIGRINDIEIMFLHYKTFEEAKEKWDRRKKRINKDKIIYKFSEQNLCTYEDLKKFDDFKVNNKICFTYNSYPKLKTIQFDEFKTEEEFSDSSEKVFKKYINIYDYVNNMKIGKIRILTLVADLDKCNGISSYVMNYYTHLDSSKIQMDFIVTGNAVSKDYKKSIEENGSKIYMVRAPRFKTMYSDLKKIKNFMKNNKDYDIIHSHLVNLGYFYLKYSKKAKINVRIEHSHTVIPREKNLFRDVRNQALKKMVIKQANVYFACSKIAGESLFRKKTFYIIQNAINTDDYVFNDMTRKKYRKDLDLNDKIVLGHVGRFDYVKNQEFLVKMFNEIYKENKNYKLLLIGDGVNKDNIKRKIKKLELEDSIKILGTRDDVNNILQAIDIFLFPSSFEGLGLAAIEAQAADLSCILSKGVPNETAITEKVKFVTLDKSEWIDAIKSVKDFSRKNMKRKIVKANFDLESQVKKIESIYKTLV